ncbi:MAG: PIN domain-containing protein [Nanoarchaeota archaeon]
MKIIIDTNAWMAIYDFNLDLFSALERDLDFPYKLYVLQATINELRKIISEQRGRYKQAALLALGLIKDKKVEVINELGNVDALLVERSKKGDLVLTQDIALKKKLKRPYLTIRQKKRIMVVE